MASTQADRTRAHRGELPTSVSRLGFVRIVWALLAAVVFAGLGEATPFEPSQGEQQLEEERKRWTVWSEAEHQWGTMERVEGLIILLTPQVARLADAVLIGTRLMQVEDPETFIAAVRR